jgi:hypothetical protein
MIITSSRNFNIFIRHSNILCIYFQVVWCGHNDKLNSFFISKRFICPVQNVLAINSEGTD